MVALAAMADQKEGGSWLESGSSPSLLFSGN
jgi:hypothetical protein